MAKSPSEHRRDLPPTGPDDADRPPSDAEDWTRAHQPPVDADDWTDAQWLAWLRATDEPDGDGDTPPGGLAARARSSVGGHVLGQAMLGLANALYGRKSQDVVIVRDASGDPPGDDDLEVHLDPEHPDRSEVIVRRRPRPRGGAPAT